MDKINNYIGDCVIQCLSSKSCISCFLFLGSLWLKDICKDFRQQMENLFHKAERDNCGIVRIGNSYFTELFSVLNTVF